MTSLNHQLCSQQDGNTMYRYQGRVLGMVVLFIERDY